MTPGLGSASCSSIDRSDPFISKDADRPWVRANQSRSDEDHRQFRKKKVALTKMSSVPLP
jgi:cobalamin biosynthesis protein CobT